jgi:dipeptidyl-peptidase-4
MLRTLLVLLTLLAPLSAQGRDPSLLTLERIFTSGEFAVQGYANTQARWLANGSAYTMFELSTNVARAVDIVRYDPATGAGTIIVPAFRLVPAGASRPLEVEDYIWSRDGRQLLIFTNSQRVWRSNTRGDYWVLSLDDWSLRQLGGDAPEASLLFAKFSPDGGRAAYVRENDIYVEDLISGQITRLTTDGTRALVNGTSDWVYEEEFGLRDCFIWSPDGERIAYWQFDSEGVNEFQMINNTDSLYPRIISFPYPKAGETNSAVRVGVVPASGGPTTWIATEGDPRNHYIPRMEWAASSEEVVLQRLNRLQNTNWLLLGNALTGDVDTILFERDEAWLDVVEDLRWLDGGDSFTWVSDRDGWRHVYVSSRSGSDIQLVTSGDFDVVSVENIDEAGGWLYYIASPDDPKTRYLYRTRLDGSGSAERLTPTDLIGTHSYQMSPGAEWAIHTYSSFGVPPVFDIVRLPEHSVARTLADNAGVRARLAQLRSPPVEFFRVDNGEGVPLDCWLLRPPDFDSTAHYPVLFYVYGEPSGQTVANSWGGATYLWHLMLSQQGYLVASVDNRGISAPRGREWRKGVYRKIGVHASADQAAAAQAIASRPYVDESRIGIWGWSGGGSMSLNMIFREPTLYNTAMAVAPVPDMRYYDTIYQERYMGLPSDNAEDYRLGSPITFAHQLEGNLLVVHGTGDDNVHYQGTEALINALVAAGKQFTMMAYPNRSHGIYEGAGTTLHVYTLLTEYLMDKMPPL